MLAILRLIRGVLSPTLALAQYLRPKEKHAAAAFIRSWNLAFLVVAVATWGLVCAIEPGTGRVFWLLAFYLWVLPFSRVNEILYAFLRDGLDRIKGDLESTALRPYDRVILVSRSYVEVIVNFGLLYYLAFRGAFNRPLRDAVEAIYFSAITITTVGYGDLAPSRPVSQLLVVYEVLLGVVLVVVAVSAYIDKSARPAEGE
jgi:hypothetical protein